MKRASAVAGLLAVLFLLPLGLIKTSGPPFVPEIDVFRAAETLRGNYIPVDAVIRGLGLVCWLAWIYLLFVVVLRIAAVAVEKSNPRAGASLRSATDAVTPRWIRRALDLALSSTMLLSAVSGVAVSKPVDHSHVLSVAAVANPNYANPAVGSHLEYVVKPGDSLWDIAEEQLGSGYRWREIFQLNHGRVFSDGRSLVNPHLIHPGWGLIMPQPSVAPSEALEPPPPAERIPSTDPSPIPTVTRSPDRSFTTRHQEQTRASRDARPVIELPAGGVLAASFASGILAAQALSALRRRRSRKALAEPDDAAESPLVLDLRRQVEIPAAGHLEAAASEVAALWQRVNQSLPRFPIAREDKDRAILYISKAEDTSPVIPPSTSRIVFRDEGHLIRAEVGRPFPPKPVRQEKLSATGMFIPIGARRGTAVHLGVLATGGLAVTGAGAASFTAQALLSCAADAACEDLEIYMIGDEPVLADLRNLNHVRAVASWHGTEDVLQRIQAEMLRRARLLMNERVDDLWSYCAADREEPLHVVLIVMTQPPQVMIGIAEAISAQGMRLGVGVIALGWIPAPISIALEADRKVHIKAPLPGIPELLLPFHLSPGEISQAVAIINSARPPAWDVEAEGGSAEADDERDEVHIVTPDLPSARHAEPPPSKIVVNEEPVALTDDIPLTPAPGQLEIRSFGNLVIVKDGRTIEKGLRTKAREVLAFLVAHPQGVSRERIWDALWPEVDPEVSRLDLNRSLYNLRKRTGRDTQHITRARENYRLNFENWWADAVAFESQFSRAGSLAAEDSIETLSRALDLYKGPFCDDCYFHWLEPVRDRYRSIFVKSSARLANLFMEYDRADEAIVVLDRAIQVDLVNEDLYRRAMAIEGRLGRRKAVHERLNKLQAILQDELDVDPDEETASLFRGVMANLERERKALRHT
jgi:DNA-binding SARP family transcriptional activator